MKTTNYLLSFTIIFFILNSSINAQRTCGADHYHEEQMKDENYRKNYEETYRSLVKKIRTSERLTCSNTITVPMAFHFSGSITNANMTCIMNQVNAQIDILNRDFGGYNTDITNYCQWSSACPTIFPPNALGNNSCIQFCLATILPAGATSAITFGQHTWPTATNWTGIFNVFVSDVAPSGSSSGLLGLAPLGGAAFPDGNGMFITSSAFGGATACTSGAQLNGSGIYNKGRTGTHEAGHYFNLRHIFQGCNNGDEIADTPDQDTENGGSPTVNTSNCTTTAINSCGTTDFFFNYMDYVDDVSMYMFTNNQMQVMKSYAEPQSKWTGGCSAPSYTPTYPPGGCPAAAPPTANFTNNYAGQPLCPALAKINFIDISTGFPTGWSWTFSGAGVSPTTSTAQNPMITYTSSGTITATLIASNSAGNSTPKVVMIPVLIESPTNCGNCGQTFVDDGGASGNYPAVDKTYVLCSDNATNTFDISFSIIDMEPWQGSFSATDHIKIYEGSTSTGTPVAYMFGNSLYTLNGSSLNAIGTTFQGTANCYTFFFDNSGGSFPGWEGVITCKPIPTCSDGIQNQNETFVDCGGVCSACPPVCDNFTFTDIGGSSGNAGSANKSWQICATAPEKVILDFTQIDLGPGSAQLYVYDGTSTSGNPLYLLDGTNLFVHMGGGSYGSNNNNTISSTGQCFTILYNVGSSPGTVPGWVALVNCCTMGACPAATNNGGPITNAQVSTVCPGYNLSNFAMFRDDDPQDRACTTPTLEFKTFYMVQCDGSGGSLGIDVSANSSGGNVQAGLYGPLTGTCPNYTGGGTYVDCEDGTNPAPLTITNAPPNSLYAVVITSDRAGDFTINSTPGSSALPVKFSKFTVSLNDNDDAQINWSTASEINNQGFYVERSSDNNSYESIHFEKGVGYSAKENAYSHLDKNLLSGTYYYRIRQVDFDGLTSYSDVLSVNVKHNNEVKIYPNPSRGKFNIASKSDIRQITVYNVLGIQIYNTTANNTSSLFEIDLSNNPKGIYFMELDNGFTKTKHQVIIMD